MVRIQIRREARGLSGGKHQITLKVAGPDSNGSADELRSAFGNRASNAVRDTPAVLAKYAAAFHPSFVGLTASEAVIAATTKDFKVFYEDQPRDYHGFYSVDHNSGIFVFDPQGRLRLFMGAKIWVDAMVHDLELLLHAPTKAEQS